MIERIVWIAIAFTIAFGLTFELIRLGAAAMSH